MTNKRELKVLHQYKEDGWQAVRCGAPDFLFFKDDKDGNITNVKFVEVKSPTDKLKMEQLIWRKVLVNFLKADYEVKIVD